MRGRVKWWSPGEGYGFIEDDQENNMFVHLNNNDINKYHFDENQEIEFTLEEINNNTYIKELKLIEQT